MSKSARVTVYAFRGYGGFRVVSGVVGKTQQYYTRVEETPMDLMYSRKEAIGICALYESELECLEDEVKVRERSIEREKAAMARKEADLEKVRAMLFEVKYGHPKP